MHRLKTNSDYSAFIFVKANLFEFIDSWMLELISNYIKIVKNKTQIFEPHYSNATEDE